MKRHPVRLILALVLLLLLAGAAQAEKLRFVVTGDSRGEAATQQVNQPVLESINAQILALSPRPAFVVFTGDLTFNSREGEKWNVEDWIAAMKPLADAGITVYPVVGNHELYQAQWGRLLRESQEHYRKVFSFLPQNGPKDYQGLAYSISSPGGDVFIAFLDTYHIDPDETSIAYHNKSSHLSKVQLDWLDAQMGASPAKFKFTAMHAPSFSPRSSEHPDCKSSGPGHCEHFAILDKHKAAMSLAGHLHLYSRKTIDQSVDPALKNGVVQVIAGGAGAPLDKTVDFPPGWQSWNIATQYNFMIVDIDGDTLSAVAMGAKPDDLIWREIDRFSLSAAK